MAKVSILLLMILLTSLVLGACSKPSGNTETGTSISASTFKDIVLEVPTITCTGCWPRVEASARSVSGIIDVRFDSKIIQKAIIVYDPAQTNPAAIIMSIEKNGDRVIELSE